MGVSIKNEGIINPIEIDKTFMIITGEMRWRGAIEAGLKEVPCKVLELTPSERYIRQMQENLHHNTMSVWDTAKGLEHTSKILSKSPGDTVRDKKHMAEYFDKMTVALSELYGVAQNTISEYLSLLSEPKEIQDALRESRVKRTKIREANKAPEQYRNDLKMKVITNPDIPRDAISQISLALKRTVELGQPEMAEEILNADYTDMNSFQVSEKVNEICPDVGITILDSSDKRAKKIMDIIGELMKFLNDNPLDSFVGFDVSPIITQIEILKAFLKEYRE